MSEGPGGGRGADPGPAARRRPRAGGAPPARPTRLRARRSPSKSPRVCRAPGRLPARRVAPDHHATGRYPSLREGGSHAQEAFAPRSSGERTGRRGGALAPWNGAGGCAGEGAGGRPSADRHGRHRPARCEIACAATRRTGRPRLRSGLLSRPRRGDRAGARRKGRRLCPRPHLRSSRSRRGHRGAPRLRAAPGGLRLLARAGLCEDRPLPVAARAQSLRRRPFRAPARGLARARNPLPLDPRPRRDDSRGDRHPVAALRTRDPGHRRRCAFPESGPPHRRCCGGRA